MGVNPKTPRPTPLQLRHLLLTRRHQLHPHPTRIWPEYSPPHPEFTLRHPLLRLLDSSAGPTTPKFTQTLAQLTVSGVLPLPLAAGRAAKALASKPQTLALAAALFSSLPNPDAFTFNTILRSYLSFNQPLAALSFYHRHGRSFIPNHFTFPLLAKLFSHLGRDREGKMVHTHILKRGFGADLYVGNSLIFMYSCFGDIGNARKVFDLMVESDLVTWNSMVDGYAKNGMVGVARELFDEMAERDLVSWNSIIAGYAAAGDMASASDLFLVMPERDVVSWNTMVDGYAKAGETGIAREVFDKMPERNLVSWNVVLAMYARGKEYRECLRLFDGMVAAGDVKPNEATFVSVLTAYANLGELERGRWAHSLMDGMETDVLLSTALLTMYSKCGAMEPAREVFDRMAERSVVSWNSMISGYGMHGQGDKAMELFLEMERRGPRPNETTFVCILGACAHGGLVVEGWWCFDRMVRSYGIEPKVEHFGCMVDLLGRTGLLKDSEELARRMPGKPGKALWGALMSASTSHSDCGLAEIVGRKMIEMEPSEAGPYVLLSNVYAAQGRWDDVEKVREMMKENALKKGAGISLLQGRASAIDPLGECRNSTCNKSMVCSMLSQLGAHMKLSCRELDERQKEAVM